MSDVRLVHREITDVELARMHRGFDEQQSSQGVPVTAQERQTVVAVDETSTFSGCASGLATDNYWFYLTDLWVEERRRGKGLGTALLQGLENKILAIGVTNVYTWTAGY